MYSFFQLSTQKTLSIDLAKVDMFWFRKRTFNLKEWVDEQFNNA